MIHEVNQISLALEANYNEKTKKLQRQVDHYKKILKQWEECFGVPFENDVDKSVTPRGIYDTLKKNAEEIAALKEQIRVEQLQHGKLSVTFFINF